METEKLNILIIGSTGNGKSTLGNFMLNAEMFQSGPGMIAVTAEVTKETRTIQGVDLTVIDTVGFSDDLGPLENHLEQISQALDVCTGGINAVVFAIKASERFTTAISDVLTEMYQTSDLWDHCFVVFTNAKGLGNTDAEQTSKVPKQLTDERCPESLKTLLDKVQQRYVVVESKDDMGDNYHATKMSQIFQMVNNIKQHTPGPYTNRSFQLAFSKYKDAKEKERTKEIQQQEQQRLLEEQKKQLEQQQKQLEEERQRREEEQKRQEEELQRKLEGEIRRTAELQRQREEEERRRRRKRKRSSNKCVIS
ncbi:GTPase IMAP family member 7-like [Dysidea avara]|uniref:GTPase IMAP family member 7-like n=1 Tax=Dysidea avara TaxID=196820 RepID=UPI003321C687